MHTATLVHDDVVDDADQRRGFFSINALWKNKIAVLIGDYLLSKVLLIAVETKEYNLLEYVSGAVKSMSEGELLQIEKARKLDITEEVYFEIIQQKTASLLETCCVVGAASAGGSDEEIEKFRMLGRHLGLAFQIKDDLFDFERVNLTGKPAGIDIKEQKMTLPLIKALQEADSKQRQHIIKTIKKHHDRPKKVQEVVDFVRQSGGLEYARSKMLEHINQAKEILYNFPQTEERDALALVLDYTAQRKNNHARDFGNTHGNHSKQHFRLGQAYGLCIADFLDWDRVVKLMMRAWVNTESFGSMYYDINIDVYKIFTDRGMGYLSHN